MKDVLDLPGFIITLGAPGSGKSTWADKHLTHRHLRLERDRFREAIFGSRQAYHEHEMGPEKSGVLVSSMLAALRRWPYPCFALTDTGVTYRSVMPFIQASEHRARLYGAIPITLVLFDVPLPTLLQRNITRPVAHRVPEMVLTDMHELLWSKDAWWRDAGYPIIRVEDY